MNRQLWSLRALFAMEAASFALLIPRIPDIRDALALDPTELGIALAGIPVGSLAGFLIAPRFVRWLGSDHAAWGSVAFLASSFILVGVAGSLTLLLGALFVAGVGISHTEIALNAQASQLERRGGRPIMSSGHGFWSLGSIIGVLIGGMLAQTGVPVAIQVAVTAGLIVPCAAVAGRQLERDRLAVPAGGKVLPSRALLPVCLMPVGIMVIESVFMDWSAVFLTDTLAVDPFAASLGYLVFSVAMAGARLVGDPITFRMACHQIKRPKGRRPIVGSKSHWRSLPVSTSSPQPAQKRVSSLGPPSTACQICRLRLPFPPNRDRAPLKRSAISSSWLWHGRSRFRRNSQAAFELAFDRITALSTSGAKQSCRTTASGGYVWTDCVSQERIWLDSGSR